MRKFIVLGLFILCSSLYAAVKINGAGATFPYPIYSKWFSEYQKDNKDVEFNYQSIGSGGGIQQLLKQTVDFGASDAPMSDEDLKSAAWPVLHIPTVMGAVAIVYNLEGMPNNLKLSSDILLGIFMGKIIKWNDPSILKLNPCVKFPDKDILVVTRADGSGTTSVFTEYLSSISPEWKTQVGNGKSVSWPVGIGGKGNEGVTGVIQKTSGAIGYVELAYAITNKLNVFALENAQKNLVVPAEVSTSFAADSLTDKDFNSDLRLSIVNSKHKRAYPISAFTYILLPIKKDNIQNNEIRKFLLWALTQGQKFAPELHYAILPKRLSEALIKKIKAL